MKVFEHLKQLQPAPNVQMHHTGHAALDDDDEDEAPDRRVTQRAADAQTEHGAEFYAGRPGE